MDLLFSDDGDLVIQNGDLALTSNGAQEKQQMIMCRVRTNNPDWFHHPYIGADLDDLYGEPCTRETAQKGIEQITKALTSDGYISRDNLIVEAVPGYKEINFFIYTLDTETEEPIVLYWNLPGM